MAVALATATPKEMIAQAGGRSEIFAGSELENYVRLLPNDGKAALYPWSIRGFSPQKGEFPGLSPVFAPPRPRPRHGAGWVRPDCGRMRRCAATETA